MKSIFSNHAFKKVNAIVFFLLLFKLGFAQSEMPSREKLSQTVRGIISDIDSKLPLTGVTVVILGSNPIIGTASDIKGAFRLENIPIGRITLQLSYIGYEPFTISNIEVKPGKEVFLELNMQESVISLSEVVITPNKKKGNATNDMALLSTRSISTEETQRFTGGFNDPSRVIASFAGTQNSPDGSSDVIVRGNSPKYVQWRLEGVEITSPYHFDDQNAAAGGLSMINNNLLATSDFYMGAFSPEFGDVISSIYDIKFRSGNNEKLETSIGTGIMGTDVTIEGPFKKGYGGSFLFNYRYNTISMLQDLGLVDVPGVTNFQNFAFNLKLPTKRIGTFSIFGMGGFDDFLLDKVTPQIWATPGNKTADSSMYQDFGKKAHIINVGLNHTLTLTDHSFLKTTIAFSDNSISDDINDYRILKSTITAEDSIADKHKSFVNRLYRKAYRSAISYSNKINPHNKIEIGTKYTLLAYDFNQSMYQTSTSDLFNVINLKKDIGTIRNFVCWKWQVNEKLTFVTGIHNLNVLFNHKSTIEPRFAATWAINSSNSISAGYGKHSTMESVPNLFARVEQNNGTVTEPNTNLELLKAHHFVLGYEKRFSRNLRAKVDLYYQYLYDLPVENDVTSNYCTVNEGVDYRYVGLVSKGTGKNYGMEITLERFFVDNYYFLVTGSLYNSTYKALDGVERNTRYNNKYILNALAGKEFVKLGKKHNKTLAVNLKLFVRGGQPYIPLLRNAQGDLAVDPANDKYWDYKQAYQKRMEDIYQLNLSLSYKIFKLRRTHEFYIDIQNLTNNRGKLYEYYDANEPGSIGYNRQMFMVPNLMYKLYF